MVLNILYWKLVCVAVVMHSMAHIAFVFSAMDIDYRCKIPDCDLAESQYNQPWLNKAIPFKKGRPEKCLMYVPSAIDSKNCSTFNSDVIEKCDQFVYSEMEDSILKEFNLQCENNLWKLAMVGTVNNLGQFFGMMISGIVSDRYGRKMQLIWSLVLCSLCGCIKALMPTYELFLIFEFLDAGFGCGSYISAFIIGVELVGPNKRVLTGTLISSSYPVGEVLVALAAWMAKSWKLTLFICYIPPFVLISYTWLIPESIRWNISKGRIHDAKDTLRKIAKVNGTHISESDLAVLDSAVADLTHCTKTSLNSDSVLMAALKSKTLMFRFMACCVSWMTCTFLFYGLTFNSVSLVAGNKYLDFILTALIEIPAYFVCNIVIEKYGRKKTLIISYLLTGSVCFAFIFIPPAARWDRLIVYLLGKFGATMSFTTLYIISSEMFPTSLRNSFMGTCSTLGRCGSMLAPQTPLLATIWEPLPLISFVVMSGIAAVLTLIFPETLHKKLPDTVKEAENIKLAPMVQY
ncbi:solute carrier family 22 member 3-like isoform X2 [Anthonomus grandis grandis]|uniref:solute carrier family 22 member 3-like isoform X2 n=1 Tax=Anthonomus grandis grandis TaxID=2921223 RepID=UPI00216550CB|nr:solute carrier family 22 member 3-like isoform X2 [Anthonomus grandis grandis]